MARNCLELCEFISLSGQAITYHNLSNWWCCYVRVLYTRCWELGCSYETTILTYRQSLYYIHVNLCWETIVWLAGHSGHCWEHTNNIFRNIFASEKCGYSAIHKSFAVYFLVTPLPPTVEMVNGCNQRPCSSSTHVQVRFIIPSILFNYFIKLKTKTKRLKLKLHIVYLWLLNQKKSLLEVFDRDIMQYTVG